MILNNNNNNNNNNQERDGRCRITVEPQKVCVAHVQRGGTHPYP